MWLLESTAERGKAMRTFVCIVPVSRRRVTTDRGESLQRRWWLCAGRTIRLSELNRLLGPESDLHAWCVGSVSARACRSLCMLPEVVCERERAYAV